MDDRRPDDEPASKHLNDLLAADAARATPGQPARAPVFRDADAFRPSPEMRPAGGQPAFRGDAAFRDDRFDDPHDRAVYGTSLADEIEDDERPLAERGTRLGAQLIDGAALFGSFIPGVIMMSAGSEYFGVLLCAVGFIGYLWYTAYLLGAEGQTIGKRALKIRIVDEADGSNPGFGRSFGMRSFVNGIISGVPYLGGMYAIADILFIFRDDRRCLHDLLAKTVVVKDVA